MAQAIFGADQQNVVFTGPGVKAVRKALEDVTWRSVNVSGRMKLKDRSAQVRIHVRSRLVG